MRGETAAPDAMAACASITSAAERNAAVHALQRLIAWRSGVPGVASAFAPATFESPGHVFRIAFRPDFAMLLDGEVTAVHLWNTRAPQLDVRLTQAVLSLFPTSYGAAAAPGDLAVFSLRDMRFIRLREADFDYTTVAENLLASIEELFDRVQTELALGEGVSLPAPPLS
jgi:hypothetical protein